MKYLSSLAFVLLYLAVAFGYFFYLHWWMYNHERRLVDPKLCVRRQMLELEPEIERWRAAAQDARCRVLVADSAPPRR
jgi:hypothetical protein